LNHPIARARRSRSTNTIVGSLRTVFRAFREKLGRRALAARVHAPQGRVRVKNNIYEQPKANCRHRTRRNSGGRTIANREAGSRRRTDRSEWMIGRSSRFALPTACRRKLEFYSRDDGRLEVARAHAAWLRAEHVTGANSISRSVSTSLVPTFRLPTLIHTRSGNAKTAYEIFAHEPAVGEHERCARAWLQDRRPRAREHRIGYFVVGVCATEGIRPARRRLLASLGRWRLKNDQGTDRWASALVDLDELGEGGGGFVRSKASSPSRATIRLRANLLARRRVHQSLTFLFSPDPVSGIATAGTNGVRVERAQPG